MAGVMDTRQRIIFSAPHIETASGGVANFKTDLKAPLKECKISFLPKQSGSGDPSPTNVRAISGWDGVSVTRCGKNLFEVWQNGYYSPSHGIFASSNYDCTSKPIRAKTGDVFTLSQLTLSKAFSFEEWNVNPQSTSDMVSSNLLARSSNATGGTRTYTVQHDCYLTFRVAHSGIFADEQAQAEFGSTATPYEPYTASTFPITFPATGKNLFNINAPFKNPSDTTGVNTTNRIFTPGTHCRGTSYSNYFLPTNVTDYSIVNGTLSVTNKNVYGIGFALRLEPGKTYFLSAIATNRGDADYSFYASDGTFLSRVQNKIGSAVTIPSGVDVTVITFANKMSGEETSTFSDIMLNDGSTAQTYEPYTTTLYGGYVDLVSGELVGEYRLLDLGTLVWNYSGGNGTIWNTPSTVTPALKPAPSNYTVMPCYCEKYRTMAYGSFSHKNENNYAIGIDTLGKPRIRDNDYDNSTKTEFNASLSGVMIVAELAEPVRYQLTPIQIKTLRGINNVYSDADSAEVKFWTH